jgi:hypothetical protein
MKFLKRLITAAIPTFWDKKQNAPDPGISNGSTASAPDKAANGDKGELLRTATGSNGKTDMASIMALVKMLDHVYELYILSRSSRKPGVRAKIESFGYSCRCCAKEIGLEMIIPEPGETFNPNIHQLADYNQLPRPYATIYRTITCGYLIQEKLIRHACVVVQEANAR